MGSIVHRMVAISIFPAACGGHSVIGVPAEEKVKFSALVAEGVPTPPVIQFEYQRFNEEGD